MIYNLVQTADPDVSQSVLQEANAKRKASWVNFFKKCNRKSVLDKTPVWRSKAIAGSAHLVSAWLDVQACLPVVLCKQ